MLSSLLGLLKECHSVDLLRSLTHPSIGHDMRIICHIGGISGVEGCFSDSDIVIGRPQIHEMNGLWLGIHSTTFY